MLPFPVDIVGAFGFYYILLMVYNAVLQSGTHSFSVRILSTVLTYIFVFFFLDYFLNLILVTISLYSEADYSAAFSWIAQVILLRILIQWYIHHPEKMNIDEMKNFIKTSLVFGNYFRLKDVDTQEQIGTYKMKKLYKEVHGKEFTDDVIATPFDQLPTTFKKVTIEELKEKKKNYPPEYFEEISRLNSRQVTDVSVSFKFELMRNTVHSFIPFMERFIIDPGSRTLACEIQFPSEKTIPVNTAAERTRLIERIYEALHILISLEWFALYVPHISMITVACFQKAFNENMVEVSLPVMTYTISYHHLRIRASRITTGSEIEKISKIHFAQ